jgi:VCBS repeat-containing protein
MSLAPVVVLETGIAGLAGPGGSATSARGSGGISGNGALAGDSDPGGAALSVTAVVGGGVNRFTIQSYGDLLLESDGTYIFFPLNTAAVLAAPTGAPVLDAVFYTVSDTAGHASAATLNISIYRDPTAISQTATLDAGQTVTGTGGISGTGVLAGATDPDGVTLTVGGAETLAQYTASGAAAAISTPVNGAYGTLTVNADGSYSYTADSDLSLQSAFAANGGKPLTDSYEAITEGGGGTYAVSRLSFTLDEPPPPTVQAVTSVVSATGSGDVLGVNLTLSAPVTVSGGTPTLTLSNGDTATYATGSGTATLTFNDPDPSGTPAAGITPTASALNGATILDAAGAPADLSALTVQSGIADLYESILGRTPDPTGLAGWTSNLSGGSTLVAMAEAVANSPEAQGAIATLYTTELGRPVDASGLASYTQYLATGGSLAGMQSLLAASPEAQGDINTLYGTALGRGADPSGLATFTQYLAGGGAIAAIPALLANSPEAQGDIATMYQSELARAPGATELASATASLAGGTSLAALATTLASGAEAQGDIAADYQTVLGRAPDAPGLATYTQYLAGGGALATLPSILADSPEGVADVTALLQSAFGATPDATALTQGQLQLASGLSQTDLSTQSTMLGANPGFITSTGGPLTVSASDPLVIASSGATIVSGFDPTADVLQLPQSAFPTVAAVRADETSGANGVLITSALTPDYSVLLQGVSQSSLANANFQFA